MRIWVCFFIVFCSFFLGLTPVQADPNLPILKWQKFVLSQNYAPLYGPEYEQTNSYIMAEWTKIVEEEERMKREGVSEDIIHLFSTNARGELSGKVHDLLVQYVSQLKKMCIIVGAKCEVVEDIFYENFKIQIVTKDHQKFNFTAGQDVACLEHNVPKKPLISIKQEQNLQRFFIFETAKRLGLTVDEAFNSGHFNVDIRSAFGSNSTALLSYIVDYANYPELSLGVFGNHPNSALPISLLPLESKMSLVRMIREDIKSSEELKKVGLLNWYRPINDLISYLHSKVFYKNEHGMSDSKNHALNFKSIGFFSPDVLRLEHRDQFGQRDVEDFILRAEIFELRMKYLARNGFPIYVPKVLTSDTSKIFYKDQELVDAFYQYITEAGGDFFRYRRLLRSHQQEIIPSMLKNTKARSKAEVVMIERNKIEGKLIRLPSMNTCQALF